MFHKIKAVSPLPGYMLSVRFCDGCTKQYNVAALFDKYPAFAPFKAYAVAMTGGTNFKCPHCGKYDRCSLAKDEKIDELTKSA